MIYAPQALPFETNRYSVPVKYIGERVTIRASVDQIEILLDHEQIAVHPRKYGQYQKSLVLDHYLELLLSYPGKGVTFSLTIDRY
jgi:hypothetical protein